MTLKIPFPYFGGKSRVSDIIWKGLGVVDNYIEPFCGSLAVLLGNQNIPKIETINDKDCYIVNFWRAVSKDADKVAEFADYPVTEIDLHARHKWLISEANSDFKYKLENDIDFYDSKIAGYWIWGMGASIGNNWLQPKGLKALPLLSSAGSGIHGLRYNLLDDFKKIQQRLRRVRISCGDWKRIISPSITFNNKGLTNKDITGVFLDPPYDLNKRDKVYIEDNNIFSEVYNWCLANSDNPKLRIVLCGYESNLKLPDDWQEYAWKSNGGFANLGDGLGKINSYRERIWFSKFCNKL